MPDYEVVDPATGKRYMLSGDSPPTEAELEAIFSGQGAGTAPAPGAPPAAPQAPRGTLLDPVYNAMTLGVGQEALAAGYGAVDALRGGEFGPTYDAVLAEQEGRRKEYAERNPWASLGAEFAGGIVGPGAGFVKGSQALSKVAQPWLGRLSSYLAPIVTGTAEGAIYGAGTADPGERSEGAQQGAMYGLGGSVVAGAVPFWFARRSAVKDEIEELLRAGVTDARTAKWTLNSAGEVVKNSLARSTIEQGFDPGVVTMAYHANPATKTAAREMIELTRNAIRDPAARLNTRPGDVVGKVLSKQIRYVDDIRAQAGKKMDEVVEGLRDRYVDISRVEDVFRESLAEFDIGFNPSRSKQLKFMGSMFEGDTPEFRTVKGVLQRVTDRLYSTRTPSAYDVHRAKKFIDSQIRTSGMDPGSEPARILFKLRRALNDTIRDNFPEYRQVNDQYSDALSALNQMRESMARKVDMFGDVSDRQLGMEARKMFSNYQSGPKLVSATTNLDDVARQYGYQGSEDITTLIAINDDIQAMFPTLKPPHSLGGEYTAAMEAALKGHRGIGERVSEYLVETINDLRGVNPEGALVSFDKLLGQPTPPMNSLSTAITPR